MCHIYFNQKLIIYSEIDYYHKIGNKTYTNQAPVTIAIAPKERSKKDYSSTIFKHAEYSEAINTLGHKIVLRKPRRPHFNYSFQYQWTQLGNLNNTLLPINVIVHTPPGSKVLLTDVFQLIEYSFMSITSFHPNEFPKEQQHANKLIDALKPKIAFASIYNPNQFPDAQKYTQNITEGPHPSNASAMQYHFQISEIYVPNFTNLREQLNLQHLSKQISKQELQEQLKRKDYSPGRYINLLYSSPENLFASMITKIWTSASSTNNKASTSPFALHFPDHVQDIKLYQPSQNEVAAQKDILFPLYFSIKDSDTHDTYSAKIDNSHNMLGFVAPSRNYLMEKGGRHIDWLNTPKERFDIIAVADIDGKKNCILPITLSLVPFEN